MTEEERKQLNKELKSSQGIVVRRSQIILMSGDEGIKTKAIGERVGYSDETVRQVIQRFNQEGLGAVYPHK